MPIYEYQCQRCEKVSEFFLRVSDPHPEKCPKCGQSGPMKKQISQTSFSLKGEGWYVTDYKQGSKEAAKPEVEAKSASTDAAVSFDAATPAPAAPSNAAANSSSASSKESSSKAAPSSPASAPDTSAKPKSPGT